jgi:DNA primase
VSGILEEFEKDDIKKNIDIIELFNSFNVELKKVGKNFMGLCPFHEDHNPSLSVDREKGLYNCFGCGESGDVFDLVEKMKGLNFVEAKDYLKGFRGAVSVQVPLGVSKPKAEPKKAEAIDLNQIVEHYHKKLFESSQALDYLTKRGLTKPDLYKAFQIGFADGSLLPMLSEGQKEALKETGILNDKGREHFFNCITFPIFDDTGAVVGFYGRDISEGSTFKHRYLKGQHKSVFNRKASKVYDEIILTECIIDALSLIELGIENVQSIYGTKGFTDEHLKILKDDRVKTIVLALDNDEAGQKASEAIKERLIDEGFKIKIISPFSGKDWNESLTAGKLNKDDLKALIEQAAVFEHEEIKQPFTVKEDGHSTIFNFDDIVYKAAGAKENFVTSLRVNLRVEFQNEKYFDNLDLYSARSRTNYSLQVSRLFGLEPKRIEKNLMAMVDYFEAERDKKSRIEEDEKPALSEEEKRAGLEFLRNPELFNEIIKDMDTMGYVGEDLNKQLLYICASSRVLDDPMSVLILSESASGKSMLVDTVSKLIPSEDVVAVTSLSDQALNYVKDLTHKFLILGEAVHSDIIEHQIREMLSGKQLSRLVTVKDEKTGKMESKIVKTPVIVSSVMSSTANTVNPENASRCFIINTDESREQTRKIHEIQRQKYTLDRYFEKSKVIPEIIKKHHAAQRLLKKFVIVNPFGSDLGFPDNLMRTRRDNDRFMDLIACVCFLRQYQKTVKVKNGIEYIECDETDLKIASDIVEGVLSSGLLEIPTSAVELFNALRRMSKEISGQNGLKVNEIRFTQRDIREKTGYNQCWIKRNLRVLIDFEYVIIIRGGSERAKGYYRLREDEDIEKIDLSMLRRIKS